METIEYGLVVDDYKWGTRERDDLIKVGPFECCELTQREIDEMRKELPNLLKKGESLQLTTHLDHDDYYVIEVVRGVAWPEDKSCDVRVFLTADGNCIYDAYSREVDLEDDEDIDEFIETIFEIKEE